MICKGSVSVSDGSYMWFGASRMGASLVGGGCRPSGAAGEPGGNVSCV